MALGELITADDLTEAGVIAWLGEGPWRVADLPALVKAEIGCVLALRLTAN